MHCSHFEDFLFNNPSITIDHDADISLTQIISLYHHYCRIRYICSMSTEEIVKQLQNHFIIVNTNEDGIYCRGLGENSYSTIYHAFVDSIRTYIQQIEQNIVDEVNNMPRTFNFIPMNLDTIYIEQKKYANGIQFATLYNLLSIWLDIAKTPPDPNILYNTLLQYDSTLMSY